MDTPYYQSPQPPARPATALPPSQIEAKPAPHASGPWTSSPLVRSLVEHVSPVCVREAVDTLAGFGTRHTLSDTSSPTRGIGAARRYLHDRLASFAHLEGSRLYVTLEEFDATPSPRLPRGAHLVNVMGVLPGTMPSASKRAYYVIAHYDSRAADLLDADADAPGADDNASGCAVVLELARLLATHPLEATVVFLFTAGSHQGQVGARFRAGSAAAMRAFDVAGVLNFDVVGDPLPPAGCSRPPARDRVRVFSEGAVREGAGLARCEQDGASRQLVRHIAEIARVESLPVQPMPVFRGDPASHAGDQAAFLEHGFPSLRFAEPDEKLRRLDAAANEHDGDLARFVDETYAADVARLGVAALVHLAQAPSPPTNVRVLAPGLEVDTLLRWNRSPEADVAGYEVVWRDTTTPLWQHALHVPRVTEARVPENKDNFFFGVRAIDKDGYRSPAAFATISAE